MPGQIAHVAEYDFYRALKRELEILEKRVLQMKGSAAASGAGAVAEGGETALGLAVASKGRGELTRRRPIRTYTASAPGTRHCLSVKQCLNWPVTSCNALRMQPAGR